MPLCYSWSMDDCNNSNQLLTILPSVLPADHGIPIPSPSANISRIFPLPTTQTKGKDMEKDRRNHGGNSMDLGNDLSEKGSSIPSKKEAGMIPPLPTEEEAGKILPASTETSASTVLPAHTKKAAGTTHQESTDSMQKGPLNRKWPGTQSSRISSSDIDTENDKFVCCLQAWLSLHLDCKKMLDDETKTLAPHQTTVENKAILIFQQGVNKDHELWYEPRHMSKQHFLSCMRQLLDSIIMLAIPCTVQVVTVAGKMFQRVVEESRCARSESPYVIPLGLWFSLGLCLSFG